MQYNLCFLLQLCSWHCDTRSFKKKVLCCAHLTVEEAETNFGAVNHPSIILHIDAALLPAADRVVRKRRIPFDVFYRLQIFRGHFLQPTSHNISSGMSAVKQSDLNLKSERLAQGLKTTVLFGMQMNDVMFSELMEVRTFLGVTVQRIFMMLLDFSCPSWGLYLRNKRLLSWERKTMC